MVQLYTKTFGQSPKEVKKLSGAGSNRQYYRITSSDGTTCIGVIGESYKENHAFLAIADQMNKKGINVPKVIAVSNDEMTYFLEDLGDTSIYDIISKSKAQENPWSSECITLLEKIMTDLPNIQFEAAEGFDFNNCSREQEFCPMVIRWDMNYFKYCFLKLTGITFDELKLEAEFYELEKNLMHCAEMDKMQCFLYRDFQSRNVMIKDGQPYYIDFQGGYRGPFYYDVASFLWQARAAYPQDLRNHLIDVYLKALQNNYTIEADTFKQNLSHFVFFRLLQVLGAYGFRGLHEHKTMFIEPIQQALKQILQFDQYTYIHELLEQVAKLPQFNQPSGKGKLTVRITSFSFKKGIPEDYSGNGGGFVFDCRAPHNPGRYEEYKKLTGLDQPVIDFLENSSSMPAFLENVYGLVDPAVETYLQREFTSLMVNFGCTGGRHRSVFCAQHLAEHLAKKYPDARIILTHREQGIYKEYNT